MRPSRFLLAILLVTGGVVERAHAAPPSVFVVADRQSSDRADDLVKRALAFADVNRWAEAEPLLREAWSLKQSYDIAANLGIAEVTLSKWRDAAEHLTFALKSFPANGKAEHKKLVEIKLAEALPHVASVTIEATVDKAEIAVDGKVVGAAPLEVPVFVESGTHAIKAGLPEYEVASRQIETAQGTAVNVLLVLKKPSRAPSVVLGITAGAALATGLGLLVAGSSQRTEAFDLAKPIHDARRSCVLGAVNYDAHCPDLQATASRADRLHDMGVGVLLGAGALGAATIAYFAWPRWRVSVTPRAGASGTGLWVSGSF